MSFPPTAAGSLGPRLAGRLTAELILRSPQYMSCIGMYHLDLRGNRIGAIENLGATQNQFDSIDLSDNNVIRIEGFARLERLRILILCNNRVASIAAGLQKQLPNLDTLVLANNKLEALSDLDPLAECSKLCYLSLLENPVSKNVDFRLYAIFKLKKLKVLNFQKVTQKERDRAEERFVSMTAEQVKAQAAPARVMIVQEPTNGQAAEPAEMTAEQQMAVKVAIANAATLAEVKRLEEALKAGRMPELEATVTAMEEG